MPAIMWTELVTRKRALELVMELAESARLDVLMDAEMISAEGVEAELAEQATAFALLKKNPIR